MLNFEEATTANKQAIDTAIKGYSEAAKGIQAIAAETAGFSRKSIEDAVSHVQTLSSAKSLEAAIELQGNFVKSCYENFFAEATRLGDLYAGLAKSVYTAGGVSADKAAEQAAGVTAAAAA